MTRLQEPGWLGSLGGRAGFAALDGEAPLEAAVLAAVAAMVGLAPAAVGGAVRRDPLGRPTCIARWSDHGTERRAAPHVSNSHDGGIHAALAVDVAGCIGAGLDIVDLRRLERRTGARHDAIATRVMGDEELSGYRARVGGLPTAHALALHFALKEALAKACGAGLRLPFGLGRVAGIPPRDAVVTWAGEAPGVRLSGRGAHLEDALGGGRLVTSAACSIEGRFATAAVLLFRGAVGARASG